MYVCVMPYRKTLLSPCRKFKFVIPENKKTNYTWNTEDPTVPDGT